jgi:hypothetical protein
MLIGTIVAAATAIYIILRVDAKKRGVTKKRNLAKINKQFDKLNDNFFTRKQFRKVVDQLSLLSVYDPIEIRINSVKFYMNTTGIAIVTSIAAIAAVHDLITSMLIVVFALVMQNNLLNKRIDEVKFKILKELTETLSSLTDKYIIHTTIPEAISACERGDHLNAAFEQIYIILTANDGEAKLEEFYETTPFRSLRTLATISFILSSSGDTETKDGSAYIQCVEIVKAETDMEIRKLTLQRIKFKMLEFLPLVPMFFIGFIQAFFISNIPATAVLYNGLLGFLSRFAVMSATLIGYYYITTIISPTAIRLNDRLEFIDGMLNIKKFKSIVGNLVPKRQYKKQRMEQKLKGALSLKDIEYIYASKALLSFSAFIFVFISLCAVTKFSRDFTYDNVNTLSFTGGTPLTEEEQNALRKADAKLLAMKKLPDDTTISNTIIESLPKMTEFDRLEQVDRVKKKYNLWHNMAYHWWYILIAYAFGVGFWFIPELMLHARNKMVKSAETEDVMQMQTVITMLMYTSADTLDVLYWLMKNSVIYQDALLYAYHEYPSDPERALYRLKSTSTLPEFLSICDKLLTTVHQISLEEAFRSLITRKNNLMKITEMYQEESIAHKRRIASPFSLAPLVLFAFLLILAPLGILGVEQFVKVFNESGLLGGK